MAMHVSHISAFQQKYAVTIRAALDFMFISVVSLYLVCFLVEAGRHLQQGAAFVQCCSEGLPLLLQLSGDLLDLLGGVVA